MLTEYINWNGERKTWDPDTAVNYFLIVDRQIIAEDGRYLSHGAMFFGRGFHLRRWLKHEPNLIPGVQFTVMYDWLTAPLVSKVDLESGLESIRTRNLTVGQFMKSKLQGNYLVFVRQHVFTVINGTIHDSFLPGSRRIVKKIYKVEAL